MGNTSSGNLQAKILLCISLNDMIIIHYEKEDMCCYYICMCILCIFHHVCVFCVYFTICVFCVYFTIYLYFVYISPYMCVLCIFYHVCQGSHTSGKTGKTQEFYFKPSQVGITLENREDSKNWEKPLKFVYRWSLDNIELFPFDHCSFVPLQLWTNEFCSISFVW